jgi:hypothetical protein
MDATRLCGGSTSYCGSCTHGCSVNITSCSWNTMVVAILEFYKKISKRRFLALTSNLTWLHSNYKYQVLMPLQPESDLELNRKDIHLDTISDLGVTTFWSWSGCWNSVLDRTDRPRKSELLTPLWMSSQEIFCNIPATPGLAIVTSDSYLGS